MDYSILDYGAVADGVTNCAAAIQQAVDTASAAGGGRVVVPAGRFLSGSVLLKSNVELHLESGAVLISSLNPAEILPFPQGGDGADPDDTADGWQGGFFWGPPMCAMSPSAAWARFMGRATRSFWTRMWTAAFMSARNPARRSARA